ncbi:MAG: hypothetical protein EU539_01665 [Promethearchaeota archaeon]|nr:MAG: hypothetical protein EU539_01665 [Candidatus Lokiarchaeota archaeon]
MIFELFVYIFGVFICLTVLLLYKFNFIDKFIWYLYWIGFAIGLCWEVPLSIADDYSPYPPVTYLTPAPLPAPFSTMAIMISASLWDGGLFLLGILFVKLICPSPHFTKSNKYELGVLIAYGQISELLVELISMSGGGWEYNVYWWNPLLFTINGNNITFLPQLIWLVAPIVYYFAIIKLKPRFSQYNQIEAKLIR